MKRQPMKSSILFAIATVFGFTLHAEAAYLNDFSGNVKAATTGSVAKITGSFAVLDRLTGGSPGDVFGTGMPGFDTLFVTGGGSATFDTAARYLYIGQSVVSPTSGGNFDRFYASNNVAQYWSVTSYEQWNVFLTDNGGIVSTTNDFGTDGLPFAETAPANLGVMNPSVTSNNSASSLVGVTGVSFTTNTYSGFYSSALYPGTISRLVGYTSNLPPGFVTAASDSNYAGSAYVVPVPEPSTILLATSMCGLWLRRRLRIQT
jgi:hypothetical protein